MRQRGALTLSTKTILTPITQTLTAILVFIFETMMHPEILKKAQEEIDLIIGDSRLPDYEDRPSLPYLECVVREVYRYVFCSILHTCEDLSPSLCSFFPPVPLGAFYQK